MHLCYDLTFYEVYWNFVCIDGKCEMVDFSTNMEILWNFRHFQYLIKYWKLLGILHNFSDGDFGNYVFFEDFKWDWSLMIMISTTQVLIYWLRCMYESKRVIMILCHHLLQTHFKNKMLNFLAWRNYEADFVVLSHPSSLCLWRC